MGDKGFSFNLSTRDPTGRAGYGEGEGDVDAALQHAQRRASDDRIRRQVESHRRQIVENYWSENIARTKAAFPNYCRRKYEQHALRLHPNARAIFRDEECNGHAHVTKRIHPDIPGLEVEDVCVLCVPSNKGARGARGAGAGGDDDEDEELNDEERVYRTPPPRTRRALPAPRIHPPPPQPFRVNPAAHQARRESLLQQRSRRRHSTRQQLEGKAPEKKNKKKITHFGVKLFTNKAHAPESVFKTKKKSAKKSKRRT